MTVAQSDQIAPRTKNAISLFPYFLIPYSLYFYTKNNPKKVYKIEILISLFPYFLTSLFPNFFKASILEYIF